MPTTWWLDLLAWWPTVGNDFRFLLALPLIVALAGILADGRAREPGDGPAPSRR